jgi:hypothetical protein
LLFVDEGWAAFGKYAKSIEFLDHFMTIVKLNKENIKIGEFRSKIGPQTNISGPWVGQS